MITDIDFQQGTLFDGVFRIHNPLCREARNKNRYMSFTVKDRTGEISAYAWLERYDGELLFDKSLMKVAGSIRWFADRWYADVISAVAFDNGDGDPFSYFPTDYCPIACGVTRLSNIVQQLKIKPLRDFLLNVLRDDSIALPFGELAASHKHHHSYAGGLMEHSLECAEFILQATGSYDCQMDSQRELAVCAALLHDIGKTRTLNSKGKSNWIGTLLGHDLLTLELLAPHLAKLDHSWQDGGTALRYLLSWKLQDRGGKRPLMTTVELLQAADRISCSLHNESVLFSDVPAWKQFVSDGTNRKFWRPGQLMAQAA